MHALTGGLLTRDPLTSLEVGEALVGATGSLAPDAVRGDDEKLRPWSTADLPAYYAHPFQLDLVRRDAAEVLLTSRLHPRNVWGNVDCSADPDAVVPDDLPAFVRSAAAIASADYGYAHWIAPDDLAEGVAPGALVNDPGAPYLVVNPRKIGAGLPDLLWATVLGPAFADLIGDATIRATPAAVVEEVADRTYWIQLTGDIADCLDDRRFVLAARAAARAHLGEDLFGTERSPAARRVTLPTLTA